MQIYHRVTPEPAGGDLPPVRQVLVRRRQEQEQKQNLWRAYAAAAAETESGARAGAGAEAHAEVGSSQCDRSRIKSKQPPLPRAFAWIRQQAK